MILVSAECLYPPSLLLVLETTPAGEAGKDAKPSESTASLTHLQLGITDRTTPRCLQ